MAVPEAAMNEYNSIVFWKYDIRFTWQLFLVQPEPVSLPVKITPNQKLRLSILTTDPAHVVTALGRCMYVTHV